MKKYLPLLLALLLLGSSAFAYDVPKNEAYYKSQIQNQRLLYNETGLVQAIQKGKDDVVGYYMKAGFNPNATYTAIPMVMYAIYANQPKCLDVLLEAGANPEATVAPMLVGTTGENALSYAIKRKSSEMVKSLVAHKVDVNKEFNGTTPLNLALQKKQTAIVEILLKAGAKPDDKTAKLVSKSKDEYLKSLFE